MGLWDSITRAFSREKAAGPATPAGAGLLAQLTPYGVPPAKGTRELLRDYRQAPWLRAVAGLIARELAAVEWDLFYQQRKARAAVESHPFLDLLDRPNPVMRGLEFRELLQVWRDLKGEAFIIIERGEAGQPVGLWPIPPYWILQTPTPNVPFYRGSFGAWQQLIPQGDVLWVRELDPETPYWRGAGIGEALADELDTDEYAAKRAKAFFFNNASPEIIVSAEGMNVDAAKAAKEQWQANYGGFWNAFRSFWTGSKISVTRLDTSFKDMDLVPLRGALRDTVIQVFGVPPEKLGIVENSNRATIDTADYLFAKGVLLPRLRHWRAVWNDLLAQFPGSKGLVYEFKSPVPEDRQYLLEAAKARPTAFTDNDIRIAAGLEAVDGKDEFGTTPAAPFAQLAHEPEWVKALPPRRVKQELSEADVPNVLNALRADRLTADLDPVMLANIEAWAKDALDELGAGARFDILNPLIAPFVKQTATERISGLVNETTRETLRDELVDGIRAGESIDDLALRVESVFDQATDSRAETIARTETLRASNWATHEAHKVSGVVQQRQWVATPDERTRETHRELNGETVGVNDPFTIEGDTAMYPGGFNDPAEDINCRCTTVAVISDDFGENDGSDDEASADDDEAATRLSFRPHAKAVGPNATAADLVTCWKAYDAALTPWDKAAMAALRAGFRAQQADVLKALRAKR